MYDAVPSPRPPATSSCVSAVSLAIGPFRSFRPFGGADGGGT